MIGLRADAVRSAASDTGSMTAHLDTRSTIFAPAADRWSGGTERLRVSSGERASRSDGGRFAAFLGVLVGNIVFWSTIFIGIGLLLLMQLGLVGLIGAALLHSA